VRSWDRFGLRPRSPPQRLGPDDVHDPGQIVALRSLGDAGRSFGRGRATAMLVGGRQDADCRGNVGAGCEGDGGCSSQWSCGECDVHMATPGANGREGRAMFCAGAAPSICPALIFDRHSHGRDQAETVILAPAGRSTWEKTSWNMQPVRVTM
jgi:hypothetical protein